MQRASRCVLLVSLLAAACGMTGPDTEASGEFEALFLAGHALTQKGKHQEAIRAYRRAIDVLPGEPLTAEAYNNLGWSLCQLGQCQEAIEAYEEALALRPDYDLARNNLEATRERLRDSAQ